MTVKNVTLTLALVFSAAVSWGQASPPANDGKTLENPELITGAYKSPFEDELNTLYWNRNVSGANFLWGTSLTVVGFAATSTVLTLQGLGRFTGQNATTALVASYSTTAVAAIIALTGFWGWYDNSNKYADTLRLQSQYYNILDR